MKVRPGRKFRQEVSGMNEYVKKWLRPALFILGGALLGLGYYYLVGCTTGSCPITASPVRSMIYMALIGWLLSGLFGKRCDGPCNM